MNKNYKIMIALAAIAIPIVAVTGIYTPAAPSLQTDTFAQSGLVVDFTVYPETEPIVVERGKATQIPIKVTAPSDAEKTLQLRVTYERGNADPEKLHAALSKANLVLSRLDVPIEGATEASPIGVRDAGMLILTPAATMSPGIYTFGIEAEQQIDLEYADKLVSGTLITVEVR